MYMLSSNVCTDKKAKRLLLIREDVLPFYTVYHRIRGDRNLKQRSPFQLLNYLIFQRVKDFICYTYWFCRFLHSSQTIFLHKFKDSGYLKYYHLPLRSVAHCLQFQLLLPTEAEMPLHMQVLSSRIRRQTPGLW